MEGGEGMVAVVRGLRDSGLAVTLLDGSKQYTLVPNVCQPPAPTHVHITRERLPQQMTTTESITEPLPPARCDCTVQATDDRYATVYKTAHCRMTPTSPPVQLTEFPPQRAELCRGQGNFEVGGSGSGENYIPMKSASFRGGMNWSERGSVCSPRPSREPDAFANSLRKYPSLSAERSTEMVERLITYTQQKNSSRGHQQRQSSPTHHGVDVNNSNQVLERNCSKNSVSRNYSSQRSYEPEVSITCKEKYRTEESPTRDSSKRASSDYDWRMNPIEIPRRATDNPFNQPCCPVIKERYDYHATSHQRSPFLLTTTNSVNMEVQAAAQMVSKQVATMPRVEPIKRNVAVPLSPTTSSNIQKPTGDVFGQLAQKILKVNTQRHQIAKIAPYSIPVDLSVQTTTSSIELTNKKNCRCFPLERQSKSEETITLNKTKAVEMEICEMLERLPYCSFSDQGQYDFRDEIIKLLECKLQTLTQDIDNPLENSETIKIGKILKYIPLWAHYSAANTFWDKEDSKSKINRLKGMHNVYRTAGYHGIETKEKNLDDIIMSWMRIIPIKTCNIFQTQTSKEHILRIYGDRIKRLILNKLHSSSFNELKTELISFISYLPIEVKTGTKKGYLSNIIENLLLEIVANRNRTLNKKKKSIDNRLRCYVQPTEEELQNVISDELKVFLQQQLSLQKDKEWLKYIETELIDILIESFQAIREGKHSNVVNEIMFLLNEVGGLTRKHALIFSKSLVTHVKELFTSKKTIHESCISANAFYSKKQNTFAVNHCQTEVNSNLDVHINRLTHEIEDWLDNLHLNITWDNEIGLKEVVVNDLAGDIVDRYKYLELNPSSRGTADDELEYLKYQIFKWINKLVGEDNTETINHAVELLQRIKNIMPTFSNTLNIQATKKPSRQANLVVSTSLLDKSGFNQTNNSAACCRGTHLAPPGPLIDLLNEEYDQFVKNWVNQIPITASTPEEQALADKLKLGLYNGVWKAITKLKFKPASFNNSFYYEDAFDEELDELLSLLPETPELLKNKQSYKVQLIEKTINTRGHAKNSSAPASYKQQLLENVSNNLPSRSPTVNKSEDPLEKIQILRLVEDFILFTRYKEEDQVKANVYRQKLIKTGQSLIENVKKVHGKELKDIDTDLYTNNVFSALLRVPLPKEDALREEADEIQMGVEVEQWLADLPLDQNNNQIQEKRNRKIRNALVKRIKEIDNLDCSGVAAFKHEISQMLEKLPLQQDVNLNIEFMAEELANRVKNKAKQIQTAREARKSVVFSDSIDYDAFGQNIAQGCSSFAEVPGHPAPANEVNRRGLSYIIRDGYRFDTSSKTDYDANPPKPQFSPWLPPSSPVIIPSDQFVTLEDSQNPRSPKSPKPQGIPVISKQQQPLYQHSVQGTGQVPYVIEDNQISYKTLPESSQVIPMGSFPPNVRNEISYKTLPEQSIVQVPLQMNVRQNCQSEKQASSCCSSAANAMQMDPRYQQPVQGLPLYQNVVPNQVPAANISGVISQGQPHRSVIMTDGQMSQSVRNVHDMIQPAPNQMFSQVVYEGQPQAFVPISPANNGIPPQQLNAEPVAHSVLQTSNGYVIVPNVSLTQQPPDVSIPVNQRPFTETRQGMYGSFIGDPQVVAGTSPIQQGGYISMPVNKLAHADIHTSQRQPPQTSISVPFGPSQNLNVPTNKILTGNTSNRFPNIVQPLAEPQPPELPPRARQISGVHESNEQRNIPGHTTTYGQPQGFSTPQQAASQGMEIPPKAGKKKSRHQQRRDLIRRRLDLEDETEDESDEDERCFCMDRMWRRRRPYCYTCEDFENNDNHCYPAPFGYPYYY